MDKEDLELIARLEREEIQDVVKEELEKERDKLVKARTLTEQEEAQLARSANQALTLENCLKAITSFKRFWALVFAFVALILLFTAGWWWWISKKCDEIYKAQYEAKTAAYIAQAQAGTAWAMSESGLEAQALDKEGLIQAFFHCQIDGYRIEKTEKRKACFPKKGANGWFLPDSY
ncbi:MAG: hypothetical protein IIT71_03455 [Acetobacter sp.]|nr:hypothetical protein [Acetobacter sp.]